VRTWPPIAEPALLERLALDDAQFAAFTREMAGALGRRTYEPALLERALGYPWRRPARSYVLRGEAVQLLDDLGPAARRRTVEACAADRHRLVAFGSNASPSTLSAKFAHFPDEADRTTLVLAGDLHGFDVGASASPTGYGVMPAALFASPGTAVRAAVLWVTATQLTLLTWSELSYRLGRLEGARFAVDEADMEVDDLFAYISRFGALCVDGAPVALAAIPATGRTAAAMTQEELLDAVARLVLGPDARAEDLVRAVFKNMAAVLARVSETVWPSSQPLGARHWTAFPAAETTRSGER
jgi:hypothetical protein